MSDIINQLIKNMGYNVLKEHDRIFCSQELNNFIRKNKWFTEICDNNPTEPFTIRNETIIFDRRYFVSRYLELQKEEIIKLFSGKINNEGLRKEIRKSITLFNKKLDRYLIEIINPKLKEYNIDNIIFENVCGSVEYVRCKM